MALPTGRSSLLHRTEKSPFSAFLSHPFLSGWLPLLPPLPIPNFPLLHKGFLLFLLICNLDCDYLARNAVCRQTAQIDFPEVG